MKKTILTIFIFSLLLLIGCGEEVVTQGEEEKVVSVAVETPERGSLVNETTLIGKLEAKNMAVAVATLSIPEEVLEIYYNVGDYVEKDQVIVVLDSESTNDQVENARLSYETARRNYQAMLESVQTSQSNLKRTQALYDSGIVSKQQLEAAELQASDGQLKTLANQMNQARFAYENAQKTLDNTMILAPISGIISNLNFDVENLATSSNSLTITDMSELEMTLLVTEEVLHKMGDETIVKVKVESTGEHVSSRIRTINPVADARTGLFQVVVSVDNEGYTLNPGMFTQVLFKFTGEETLIVPVDALLGDDDGDYVFVVRNSEPVKVYVTIGESNGEIVEIKEGLTIDDQLIISGQNYVTEETTIRVVNGGQ